MSTMTFIGTLQIETCCHEDCRMVFAMDDAFYRTRRDDHRSFYCPRGHQQHYSGKSEKEQLRQELQQEKERVGRLEQARNSLHSLLTSEKIDRKNEVRALKGAKTRIMNRIKNGVCPCCNRTFGNLHRHMSTQHPDYKEPA